MSAVAENVTTDMPTPSISLTALQPRSRDLIAEKATLT